jgi:hypothetical protein
MRAEIVEAMCGLNKVGAVSGAELEKTTLRMDGKDAPCHLVSKSFTETGSRKLSGPPPARWP